MREADQHILFAQLKAHQREQLPDTLQRVHNAKLWQIFRTYGYPDYDLVDTTGAHDFWLLVQHQNSDTVLQKVVLNAMRDKVKQGKASPRDMAFLTDRMLYDTGHMQVYGTQSIPDSSGAYETLPLAYPDLVDSLRRTVGLETLADYVKMRNELAVDSAGNLYYGKKNTAARKK